MKLSTLTYAQRESLRKLIHVALALVLIIPLTPEYASLFSYLGSTLDPALSSYTILLFSALFVSTLRVRKPELRDSIVRITREARRTVLQRLKALGPLHEVVEDVERALDRAEEGFFSLIESVERDYEKRYGYVAAICAVASVLTSYALFGPAATARGILALAIVDPTASLVTLFLPRGRKILKHYAHSPLAAAALFTLALVAFGEKPARAVILSLIAALIELVSPEDNLTLPFGVAGFHVLLSALSDLMHLPS
ncbi:MAG: hypothetical protein QXF46_06625 [Thermofilaceae archaeon]